MRPTDTGTDAAVARPEVVRDADLEPSWDLKRAREPGYRRSLTTWVGGPEGYINSNLAASAISGRCAVGLMRMPVGDRQPGVHVHSVTEIYVILRGEVESFDGVGRTHRAGPLDCLYIPAGVPHGVLAVGSDDLELIWLHDGIERLGVSIYLEGDDPRPSKDEVALVSFEALSQGWDAGRPESVRLASWVGGPDGCGNYSRGIAVENDLISVDLAILPAGTEVEAQSGPEADIAIVMEGEARVTVAGKVHDLGKLDAIRLPSGTPFTIQNPAGERLLLMRVGEAPRPET